METRLKINEKNELTEMPIPAGWGAESISQEDIRRPFIKMLQKENPELPGTKAGDIIKAGTNEILGGKDKAFEVVLIKHFKEWLLVTKDGAVKQRELFTEKNMALREGLLVEPFNGEVVEREMAHVFFVLVVGSEHEGPMIISFKKSNKWTAENMLTKIVNNVRLGKSIAYETWMISSQYTTYNKFSWYAYKAVPGKETSHELLSTAFNYFQELQASQSKLEAALNEQIGAAQDVPF